MTSEQLTAVLAKRVMGWSVAPDRFLMKNRRWLPSWRFQPTERVQDALKLLDAANADEYTITAQRRRGFSVRVERGGVTGAASDVSQARAITHAVARAVGVDPDASESRGERR